MSWSVIKQLIISIQNITNHYVNIPQILHSVLQKGPLGSSYPISLLLMWAVQLLNYMQVITIIGNKTDWRLENADQQQFL